MVIEPVTKGGGVGVAYSSLGVLLAVRDMEDYSEDARAVLSEEEVEDLLKRLSKALLAYRTWKVLHQQITPEKQPLSWEAYQAAVKCLQDPVRLTCKE